MVITDTSRNTVIDVGKPAFMVGFEKDVVHVKYFTEPSDLM